MFNQKDKNIVHNPYIGEVYCIYSSYDYIPVHQVENLYPNYMTFNWLKFRETDINRNISHDNFLCIFGKHHKQENIVFYDDIYQPLRNIIINKNDKRIVKKNN